MGNSLVTAEQQMDENIRLGELLFSNLRNA